MIFGLPPNFCRTPIIVKRTPERHGTTPMNLWPRNTTAQVMRNESTPADMPGANREALADELLAIRCQLGEAAAFDGLIERWHQPLWRYVRRLLGNDDAAADTLQEVWLRVLRGMPGLRDPARLRAWLFGIAHRAVMDRLRQKYAAPEPDPIDVVDLAASVDPRQLEQELALMHDALERMPIVEREVLVLFYLQELTINQLADVLAVPVGTVKSRLFRARQMLRRQLTDRGVQP
jgi:RNA polymerase sigma factor (sigma-70 family)